MSYNNRHSIYSTTSAAPYGNMSSNQPGTLTTSSLLSALHNAYLSGSVYPLDAATSVVVNSGAGRGAGQFMGIFDEELGMRAWEHARRRAEDQTIVLTSLHSPSPSLLFSVLSTLPAAPDTLTTCLSLISAFTNCQTPESPFSVPFHRGLGVSVQISLSGAISGAHISLSDAGLDCENGLLHIPEETGYRAFDVFYYLLSAVSTPAERQGLGLLSPEQYTLLARSNTYTLPSYLPTADDTAAAEDWRTNMRAIGIKGGMLRGLLSVLAGILKLGNAVGLLVDEEVVDEVCEDVSALLGLDPEVLAKKMGDSEREHFIATAYDMLVEWVVAKCNEAMAVDFAARRDADSNAEGSQEGDTVQITILELPNQKLAKAVCLKGIFDDDSGLNIELRADGVDVPSVSGTVLREMKAAWTDAVVAGLVGMGREREYENDRKEQIIEKTGRDVEDGGFLKEILFPGEFGRPSAAIRLDVSQLLAASRAWYHLNISPTAGVSSADELHSQNQPWSASAVSRQLRGWRLPEWANRRSKRLDFTADFDFDEFAVRYAVLGCSGGRDGVESWVIERGWSNGEVVVGTERVWMREPCWWEAENMLDIKQPGVLPGMMGLGTMPLDAGYPMNPTASAYFPPLALGIPGVDQSTIARHQSTLSVLPGGSPSPPAGVDGHQTGLLSKHEADKYTVPGDIEIGEKSRIEERPVSASRKWWAGFVWALTFWIPSFMLRYIGRMKRPDVRMAWREKVVLVFLIFFMNALIIFWIVVFARLLCPNIDKAWSEDNVSRHQGEKDFWVSIRGQVYDITPFWTLQHSDIVGLDVTKDRMIEFAGKDLSGYFPPLLELACSLLIGTPTARQKAWRLQYNDTTATENSFGMHGSGRFNPYPQSKLASADWYSQRFLPKMKEFWTGDLVWDRKAVKDQGTADNKPWAIIDGSIYDLTDYFYTTKQGLPESKFLDPQVEEMFQSNPGSDVTDTWFQTLNSTAQAANMQCLKNLFYVGKVDFRFSPKCQASGYVLLGFAAMMCSVILVKFLAALQLGTKRRPAQQDKFVICQVPAYTEGEDSLRKALDSLTALNYDNKRKLLFVICDGMVVGGGNDRPTPNIVLEILGVDPKIDPPALPFKSVGEGNAQLNYGKVYSGLYEYEGCVVPYIVVIKVGKDSEANKPGNRGKRDSQVLVLDFLNKVHHRTPMSPLQLEMFHQINNIIGVDPELYEYILMVDADTSVKEDSLNRLVAACAHDAKIAGICGETSLENEERSWWTMIQVYEYYISHHLSKAFESLFGSVTCLPGCFSMYRLRTADKGRPLIISSKVIEEYSDGIVDTLHKKNLLSLGEDRYLTTLMTKHFPYMSYKFIPDAYAMTAAPESWSVLLSQRRRWINSTVHNLAELMFLEEMCGFCLFSMRFVVFLDLFGTIILPATCVYFGYLIYVIITKTGPFPYLSLGMIAGVYGLQAIIFIIKRQWQHVGWMIIYLIAFPIYSFVLPVYSFWAQDDFSWGNTRIVMGETGKKKVIATTEAPFDPKSIPLQSWDDYATQNKLPGRRGGAPEKSGGIGGENAGYGEYEMDDMHSMYSSVKPASTILTGLPHMGSQYLPPRSPAPFGTNRQSTFSAYTNHPSPDHQRLMSIGGMSQGGDYYQRASGVPMSSDNLLGTPGGPRARSTTPLSYAHGLSRPGSNMDFMRAGGGPDDESIVEAIRMVLREVDLETITKKQVRALVEQRLQTECQGERRVFLDRMIDAELASMPM